MVIVIVMVLQKNYFCWRFDQIHLKTHHAYCFKNWTGSCQIQPIYPSCPWDVVDLISLEMAEMVLIVFINPKYGTSGHHLQGAQLRGFKTRVKLRLRHNPWTSDITEVTKGPGDTQSCDTIVTTSHPGVTSSVQPLFFSKRSSQLWPRVIERIFANAHVLLGL